MHSKLANTNNSHMIQVGDVQSIRNNVHNTLSPMLWNCKRKWFGTMYYVSQFAEWNEKGNKNKWATRILALMQQWQNKWP